MVYCDDEDDFEPSAKNARRLVEGIGEFVIANYKNWTVTTFDSLCRSHNLSYPQIKKYYELWTKRMLSIKRIEPLKSIEDEQMYGLTGLNLTPRKIE